MLSCAATRIAAIITTLPYENCIKRLHFVHTALYQSKRKKMEKMLSCVAGSNCKSLHISFDVHNYSSMPMNYVHPAAKCNLWESSDSLPVKKIAREQVQEKRSQKRSTRICRMWLRKGVCHRTQCEWGHPDRSQITCKYGVRCQRRTCPYKHASNSYKDAHSGDPRPGNPHPRDPRPGDQRPGDPCPGDTRPGNPSPRDPPPGNPHSVDPHPETYAKESQTYETHTQEIQTEDTHTQESHVQENHFQEIHAQQEKAKRRRDHCQEDRIQIQHQQQRDKEDDNQDTKTRTYTIELHRI